MDYARLCAGSRSSQAATYVEREKTRNEGIARSSDALLDALRRALTSPPTQRAHAGLGVKIDTLTVVVPTEYAADFFRIMRPSQAIVVTATTANGKEHLLATFDEHNRLVAFGEAPAKGLADLYGFIREFAGFMFFNELMATDAVIPREDCSFRAGLDESLLPEIHDEVVRAARDVPVADETLDAALDAAYVRYSSDPKTFARGGDITRATLRRLGPRPPHAVVYRDVDPVSKRDIIVARFGTAIHAYVMAGYDETSNTATLGPAPICLSGDKTCAHFYVWP